MKKLLLIFLSLFIITVITGWGTAKTTTTATDNTPKTAQDKQLMEEIKQHENLTDADIAKIDAEAKQKMDHFLSDTNRYTKPNPNADFYYLDEKK